MTSKLEIPWGKQWCAKLSCTTCPREEWARTLWAIANGVSPDYAEGIGLDASEAVPLPQQLNALAPKNIHDLQLSPAQKLVLLKELECLPLRYLSPDYPDWWKYIGLIMHHTVDREARTCDANKCIAGRLLEAICADQEVTRAGHKVALCERLQHIRDGQTQLRIEDLWSVAKAVGL